MKKPLLIFIFSLIACTAMAQQEERIKEVGLVFRNLDSFGLTYKTGSQRTLWRFNTLVLSGNVLNEGSSSTETSQKSSSFGLSFGKEFRKPISDNLQLRYGADLDFRYTYTRSEYNNESTGERERLTQRSMYQPGFNLVLGLNYLVSSNIVIGVELLPGFTYITGSSYTENYSNGNFYQNSDDISGLSYGISNTSVQLAAVFRFGKSSE